MTAQIIPFPLKPIDAERLALIGEQFKTAIPVAPRDAELDLLLQIGCKLIDNIKEYEAVDCWLVRVDEWEAAKRS